VRTVARHIEDVRNTCRILIEKYERGEISPGSPKCRYNITIYVKEGAFTSLDWVQLVLISFNGKHLLSL
jgi:hypothetical protein